MINPCTTSLHERRQYAVFNMVTNQFYSDSFEENLFLLFDLIQSFNEIFILFFQDLAKAAGSLKQRAVPEGQPGCARTPSNYAENVKHFFWLNYLFGNKSYYCRKYEPETHIECI